MFDQNQSLTGQISVATAMKKKWNSKIKEMEKEAEKLVDTYLDILVGSGYFGCFISPDHVSVPSDSCF